MPSDLEGSTVIRHNFDGFPGPAGDGRLDRHPVISRKGSFEISGTAVSDCHGLLLLAGTFYRWNFFF